MRFTIFSSLESAAFLFTPIIAGVVPRELMQRDCPNQDYDPNGILCSGDSGSWKTLFFLLGLSFLHIYGRIWGFLPPLLSFPSFSRIEHEVTLINNSPQIAPIPAFPPVSAAVLFSAPTKALRLPLSITAPRISRVIYAEFLFAWDAENFYRRIACPHYQQSEGFRLAQRRYIGGVRSTFALWRESKGWKGAAMWRAWCCSVCFCLLNIIQVGFFQKKQTDKLSHLSITSTVVLRGCTHISYKI